MNSGNPVPILWSLADQKNGAKIVKKTMIFVDVGTCSIAYTVLPLTITQV